MKFCKSTLPSRSHLIKLINPRTLVNAAEIGVYRGWFAKQLYEQREELYWSQLYLIDPWNNPECEGKMVGGEQEYKEVCISFADKRVSLIKEYSQQAATNFYDEQLDLVYLDGEHTYDGVYGDIKTWWPKIKQGGILAGHDIFAPEHIGVTQAVIDSLPCVFVIPAETCSFTGNTVNPSWYIIK